MSDRVTVSLHPRKWSAKPGKEFAKDITFTLGGLAVDVTVEELADAVGAGQTWAPAHFREDHRCVKNWSDQQVIALDFDNKPEEIAKDNFGYVSSAEIIERARSFGVPPAFSYRSFSSTEEREKFRVVFVLESPVMEYRIMKAILEAFTGLFPEMDMACTHGASMFYGGKRAHYMDASARVDILKVIEAAGLYLFETKNQKHVLDRMRTLSRKMGVNLVNGLPDVFLLDRGEYRASEFYYGWEYTGDKHGNVGVAIIGDRAIGFNFTRTVTREHVQTDDRVINPKPEERDAPGSLVESIDWDRLLENSRLFREFYTGEVRFSNDVLFGIASNLVHLEGGRKRFMEGIRAGGYDEAKYEAMIRYVSRYQYPQNYVSFYPEAEVEEASPNLVATAKHRRGLVITTSEETSRPVDEVAADLRERFEKVMASDDTDVHLFRVPVGTGKTETYLEARDTLFTIPWIDAHGQTVEHTVHQGVVVATPTIALCGDVAKRIHDRGVEVLRSPALPENIPDEMIQYIERSYALGSTTAVIKYLNSVRHRHEWVDAYLNELAEFYDDKSGTVVTTHERWMGMGDDKRTAIIDEDIIPTLLKSGEVSEDDLKRTDTIVQGLSNVSKSDKKRFTKLVTKTVMQCDGSIHKLNDLSFENIDAIEQGLLEHSQSHSPLPGVMGFLRCSYFIVRGDAKRLDTIQYITVRELPTDRKIVVMSATASVKLYQLLFGDRLKVHDLGLVENRGDLTQYCVESFSRTSLNKPESIAKVKRIAGDNPVITFKAFAERFRKAGLNVVGTFGSLAGRDVWKGQDMVIVGTPHTHPVAHLMYAVAMGETPSENDRVFTRRLVQRNGRKFWFQSYPEGSILREIQCSLIELLQAVGRPRLARTNAKVTVLSNFPVPGATIKPIEEWFDAISR